jgi:tRNA-guanine family transglycosylase
MGRIVNFVAGAELKKRPHKANAYLLNAPANGCTPYRIEKAVTLRNSVRPEHLMVDSGGYQLLNAEKKGWQISHNPDRRLVYRSKEINLAPRHVMEFAAELKADIVMGLDFPICKLKTAAEREIEFNKKLPVNVRWARESAAWKKRLCPGAQLFLPIQAYTIRHLDAFISGIGGISYDGLAMPVREAKLHDIALFLTSFYQRCIGRVHLLGTVSFQKIAIAAFMSHHMFDWISLDAATWNEAAWRCGFLDPKNLQSIDLRQTAQIGDDILNDCPCSYCSSKSFAAIQGLPNKQKFELLRQHNWWAIDKAFADLRAHSTSLVELDQFLKARWLKPAEIDNLINTLALVDSLKDDDIEVLETVLAPIPKQQLASTFGSKRTKSLTRPSKTHKPATGLSVKRKEDTETVQALNRT